MRDQFVCLSVYLALDYVSVHGACSVIIASGSSKISERGDTNFNNLDILSENCMKIELFRPRVESKDPILTHLM